MTLASTTARPQASPQEPTRPALHALRQPHRRRPRLAYGVLAVAGAAAIVAAQMVLSVMNTQTSYQLSALTTQQRQVTLQHQVLHDEVAGLSSPQYLAANAAAAGMVINQSPSYLRLSDAKIIGTPGSSTATSSVTPQGQGVANALISDTPLATDPHETLQGPRTAPHRTTDSVTPPPVTGGLPAVRTH